MTTYTGLFPIRIGNGGPRPAQPHQRAVRAARQRADDERVAELLAEGLTLQAVAAAMGTQRSKVNAAFARICASLGDQALGEWRI